MKYYFIRQPVDKKIVGINDGSVQAEIIESKWKDKKELKRYNEEYILGVHKIEERIEKGENVLPPVIEYIKVRPKAILTDFLSFSEGYPGGRFLVSDKVRDILKSFNVNCRFYADIGLYHMDKRVEGYSNFHLLPFKAEKSFVFEKCIFFTGTSRSHTKTLHYAADFTEYRFKKLINIEFLALKEDEIDSSDMFTFNVHAKIYISDRLRNAFEGAGVTGIDYHEPDEPKLEVI